MKIDTLPAGPLMTNCYLLCDEEAKVCALIDPGGDADRLERMVADSGCELTAILLTHGHFDHCGAVRELVEKHPDVPVYIHRYDTVDPDSRSYLQFPRLDERSQRYYAEGDTIAVGGIPLTVWETPGHSRGSVCLLGDGFIFSGDTLFRGSCGRTDFPGGSFDDILQSLARLGRLEGNRRVYPGHERATDLDSERRFNPYLQEALSH